MDEEKQEKIRTALQEGHVPDEDWKGVSLETTMPSLELSNMF